MQNLTATCLIFLCKGSSFRRLRIAYDTPPPALLPLRQNLRRNCRAMFCMFTAYSIILLAWTALCFPLNLHAKDDVHSPKTTLPAESHRLRLAAPFQDNAVLQRDQPIAIWGLSVPGDSVTVEFFGQSKTTVAQDDSRWLLRLDPLPVLKQPHTLTAKSSKTGESLEVSNVVVGDVWLCSGQSNMLWSLMSTTTGAEEMAGADFPLVRGFTLRAQTAEEPAFDVPRGQWIVARSNTDDALQSPIRHLSGVAYHFAKKMFEETGVPIGFIQPAYGGTIIEAWLSPDALAESPYAKKIKGRWQAALERLPEGVVRYERDLAAWQEKVAAGETPAGREPRDPRGLNTERHRPGALYLGMIAPFVPYGVTGFLWYQGESNAARPGEYADLFPRLLRQFRADFGDHPFYFVQLANFDRVRGDPDGRSWAYLREAQAALLTEPDTGMAVTIDIGEADDVHPRNKAEVGQRLALHALRNGLGRDIPSDGPQFLSATPEEGAIRVHFKNSPELDLRSPDAPKAFEVAGGDGIFHPATAEVQDGNLLVSSEKVPTPIFVRYAWFNNPTAVLFSTTGLPAAPFRNDTQPPGEPQAEPEP